MTPVNPYKALSDSLQANTHSGDLYLDNSWTFNEDNISDLTEPLAHNTSLTSLGLCTPLHQLQKTGLRSLEMFLRTNTSLKTLYLSCAQLGEVGTAALMGALRDNRGLTELFMNRETMESGAVALAGALALNPHLQYLHLYDIHFTNGAENILAGALASNRSLTKLYIASNQLGDLFGRALGTTLKVNTRLSSLRISGNQIGDRNAVAIGEGLRDNSSHSAGFAGE